MIETRAITKSYGKKIVLREMSFSVADNTAVCIIGRNGCGKSTLLSIMAGILQPDQGGVFYDGVAGTKKEAVRMVGFVAQQDNLFEELSVRDNIRFWAAAAGVRLKEIADDPFARLLGLTDFQKARVRTLSGGMKRRVAICAALVCDPKFIILDEPFAGLDLFYKQELIGYLQSLKALGKTIVYTCHNADEIIGLSDVVYVIDGARIVYQNESAVLLARGNNMNELFIGLIN